LGRLVQVLPLMKVKCEGSSGALACPAQLAVPSVDESGTFASVGEVPVEQTMVA